MIDQWCTQTRRETKRGSDDVVDRLGGALDRTLAALEPVLQTLGLDIVNWIRGQLGV